VDGEPFSVARDAQAPPATDNPVVIGSGIALGAAFAGEIEFVRIYRRMASSGMFRQFFIERDKGPIHPDGRRCPT
jgi:hypothetical protein